MVLPDKWTKSSTEGWGMGFLLVFFPEDGSSPSFHTKKKTLLPLNSPVAAAGKIISKTQTTLSICGLLLFTTLLLFTLTSFEPPAAVHQHRSPRRLLLSFSPKNDAVKALQGMGVLYRRGTQAMSDLVVAHVPGAVDERELRAFLRILHLNGLLSRADLVFIFSPSSVSSRFSHLIREENSSLLRLVLETDELNRTSSGLAHYFKTEKEQKKETKDSIWGKEFRGGNSNQSDLAGSNQLSYGSVVGFDASELDPENTLSGFLDHASTGLWRWACYPMLLGRIRRSYKRMALIDVNDLLILGDPFTRVRNRSPESVFLWTHPNAESGKGEKHRSHHEQKPPVVTPAIVVGGSRGVRRLCDVVLTEIVRAVVERKGKWKNSLTESGIVNQLVHNGHVLKNVNVVGKTEPVADLGELVGSGFVAGSPLTGDNYVVVKRGQRGSHVNLIKKDMWCRSKLHTEVYRDCLVDG